jgi:hypothetical protein
VDREFFIYEIQKQIEIERLKKILSKSTTDELVREFEYIEEQLDSTNSEGV